VGTSLSEQLTTNYYRWERQARGWQVWDHPVAIEPPFEPFYHHLTFKRTPVDDGRSSTFLSSLADRLRESFTGPPQKEVGESITELSPPPTPAVFDDDSPSREINISLTRDEKLTPEQVQQFLLTVSNCSLPLSFEIIGTSESISVQFVCRETDLSHVTSELHAYFPSLILEVKDDFLAKTVSKLEGATGAVIDFGLSEEFMRPLRSLKHFDTDPLVGIIGALESLNEGEVGILQVLFEGTHNPWTESVLRSVSDGEGGSFFADSPEMLSLAKEKTGAPLFAAVIRIVAGSSTTDGVLEVARRLAGSLSLLSEPTSNELIPLTNDDYPDGDHLDDVFLRRSHRSGMLLNCRELATIIHPLSASIQSAKLQRHLTKTRLAPRSTQGHSYLLGENIHRGKITHVSLETRQRLNHIHIVGATGTGKSTLLNNLIAQDVEAGNGLAVIDPHGDLIERVMSSIPRRRFKDVILFDPSDSENPIGINILSAKSEAEKNVAASDLISLFQRSSTTWGDQMSTVLGNAIQAFLESDRGGTLLDLRKFLLEDDFRRDFLRTVKDAEIRYFWEKQFQMLRGGTIGSLMTRLDTFLRSKTVRKIVAPQVDLQIGEVLDRQKILLIKLAQGLIGEENSTLLGTLMVSKLHQVAMARQSKRAEDRTPFFLYIDEFQNFITPSLAGVLSGTRKYGLGLVLAHQELRQIYNQDTGVANSVISNPGTRICFRCGDFDAQKLQDGFVHFNSHDLQNLGLGEAIVRVEKSEDDFNLKILKPRMVTPETTKSRLNRLIEISHHGYRLKEIREDQEIKEETSVPPIEEKGVLQTPQSETRERAKPFRPRIETDSATPELPVLEAPGEEKTQSQHRYLQTLIKRMAEDRGFRADIELKTPDGLGKIDVGLQMNEQKIAIEISITTDQEQEYHNIEKCLSVGYKKIILCSPDRKKLERVKTYASQRLGPDAQQLVSYLEPEELFRFLNEQVSEQPPSEERVKGYRVKVNYDSLDEDDAKRKREAVTDVVLKSMRRLKEN